MLDPASQQNLLRSDLPPAVEVSESDDGRPVDVLVESKRDEPAQGDGFAARAPPPAAPQSANNNLNPYAPPDWFQDPPLVNPNPRPAVRASAARPTQQKILSDTLTAITSLQQCVASLAAVVQNAPPTPQREIPN